MRAAGQDAVQQAVRHAAARGWNPSRRERKEIGEKFRSGHTLDQVLAWIDQRTTPRDASPLMIATSWVADRGGVKAVALEVAEWARAHGIGPRQPHHMGPHVEDLEPWITEAHAPPATLAVLSTSVSEAWKQLNGGAGRGGE